MPLKTWKMNRLSRGHHGVVTKIYMVLFKITWPFADLFMVGMAVELNKEKTILLQTSQQLFKQFCKQFKTGSVVAGLLLDGALWLPVSR